MIVVADTSPLNDRIRPGHPDVFRRSLAVFWLSLCFDRDAAPGSSPGGTRLRRESRVATELLPFEWPRSRGDFYNL